MRPSIVIFDMDDVLCRYDLGRRLRSLARMTGRTPRDIRAAIWDSGFEDDADAGAYPDADDYLAEFSRRIGHTLTRQQWIEARRQSMTPQPSMLALAAKIASQSRLALFTNNGPLARATLGDIFPEAAAVFQERYFSYEFATKKPDPASFLRLTARLGAEPEACFFIDDKRSNVAGARMAGLGAHHFRNQADLVRHLGELGFATS
jgi:putative hydrolase of the HAD superfamily